MPSPDIAYQSWVSLRNPRPPFSTFWNPDTNTDNDTLKPEAAEPELGEEGNIQLGENDESQGKSLEDMELTVKKYE